MPPSRSRRRTVGFSLLAAIGGLVVVLAATEATARKTGVDRIQEVRPGDRTKLRVAHGAPVWDTAPDRAARLTGCADGRVDALLAGSSIFMGVGLETSDTPFRRLEAHGVECVVDQAQSGFAFQQQLAMATEGLARWRPKVVIWEIWQNTPRTVQMVGEAAFNFGSLQLDELLLPNPLGVRPDWNRRAFVSSAAWRKLVVSRAVPGPNQGVDDEWRTWAEHDLAQAHALVSGVGAELLLVFAPALDRPFEQSVAQPYSGYAVAHAAADELGIATLSLAEALVGESVEALRLDPCCHYNAAGADAVARVIADRVRSLDASGP